MLNHFSSTLDPIFHALADGTRRQIVARLTEGPASVSELAAPLPMSLPAVLQHLRVLEDSGLVTTRKEGRVRICEACAEPLSAAAAWIADRRAFWERAFDRLADHLDQDKDTSS